ncbi:ribonuclease H-like domain-containing protein [Tanacetum coccineum]
MDLCGLMRVESINGKKYVLVIIDDYSRYTWTHFLISKDETPEVLIDFLRLIQRGLHAQNGVFERRNCTLVETARTMLSATKIPLFFWAEAITTPYTTQLDIQTAPEPTTQEPTVIATENIDQAENTQFGKKRDNITTLHEVDLRMRVQCLETASQFLATPSELTRDGVKSYVTASEHSRLKEKLRRFGKAMTSGFGRRRRDSIPIYKPMPDSETNEPPLITYQLWKKTFYEETHKLNDMTELPKSQPKKTYEEDLESEIVMVKMPSCMPFLGCTNAYDEPIEYTSPVTYLEEVEETLGTPIEVEPLDQTKLKDVDISLGDERGPEPPIKSHSPGSFKMKEVDHLTIHTPPSPHVASFHPKDVYCYYHPCIDDPKKHYGFKPDLLGPSGSLGVDFLKLDVIENNFLEGLSLPIKRKELEKGVGDGIRIFPDGIASPATVTFDEEKPGSSQEFHVDDSWMTI